MSALAIRKWADSMMGTGEKALESAGMTVKRVKHTGHALRQGSISAGTGALLGYASSQLKTGLDIGGSAPLDGIVAIAGLAGSVALANDEDGLGLVARDAGSAAAAIFAFRKMEAFGNAKKGATPSATAAAATAHGEDPILAAARHL